MNRKGADDDPVRFRQLVVGRVHPPRELFVNPADRLTGVARTGGAEFAGVPASAATAGSDHGEAAAVRLEAVGVTKSYRRGVWPRRRVLPVLRGADLRVGSGEIVGLVGENGSGKSTLMKILVGALAADTGDIRVSGRIGYCPQEPVLYDRLTCDEHLELFGVAYEMTSAEIVESAETLYVTLGFANWRSTRVEELSGGTRAKLNLAIALLADPEILLLDEPYAGFDWDTYQRFWALAGDRRSAGRSVLVISHFVTDRERFDRIVELRDGTTTAS